MRTLLKWLLRLIVLAIVVVAAFFVHVWYFKPYKIDWFYGRVFAEFALQSPELLSNMRILPPWLDFYSDKLDDASPAHEAEMAAMIKRDVDVLHRYDRNALDRDGRLSYDVLDYFLSIQVEGDRFRDYDFPVNQLQGIQSSLPNFMAQTHQVNDEHDAKAYVARLDKFPVKFAQVLEALKLREGKGIIPPKFTVAEVVDQMKAFIEKSPKENMLYTSFREKLDKIAPDEMDQATRDALLAGVEASIAKNVYPAYRTLIDYFAALQPKADGNYGAWHLPDGDAYYAWCVRMHTTTDMTPEEVHTLGLAEVARIAPARWMRSCATRASSRARSARACSSSRTSPDRRSRTRRTASRRCSRNTRRSSTR